MLAPSQSKKQNEGFTIFSKKACQVVNAILQQLNSVMKAICYMCKSLAPGVVCLFRNKRCRTMRSALPEAWHAARAAEYLLALPRVAAGYGDAHILEVGLVVLPKWSAKILAGEKTAEMRSTLKEEWLGTQLIPGVIIGIIVSGTNTVAGQVTLGKVETVTQDEFFEQHWVEKHRISKEVLDGAKGNLSVFNKEGVSYAYTFTDAIRYATPLAISYRHGCVTWHTLLANKKFLDSVATVAEDPDLVEAGFVDEVFENQALLLKALEDAKGKKKRASTTADAPAKKVKVGDAAEAASSTAQKQRPSQVLKELKKQGAGPEEMRVTLTNRFSAARASQLLGPLDGGKRTSATAMVAKMKADKKSDSEIRKAITDTFSASRASQLLGPLQRPNSKKVVEMMEAEGKNRTEIRRALKLQGFGHAVIALRTKHMERPSAATSAPANASAAAPASNNSSADGPSQEFSQMVEDSIDGSNPA